MTEKYPIVIVGSVAYDNIMQYASRFTDQLSLSDQTHIDTCFVVEKRTVHFGGTAANLAIGFKKLEMNSLILSMVGEDIEEYCRELDQHGLSTAGLKVLPGEKTLTAFITTDSDENQLTIVHPGAFSYMNEIQIQNNPLITKDTQLILINPLIGDASRKIADQCLELDIPFVFDPGQNINTITKEDLIFCAKNAQFFIVNRMEFEAFQKITGLASSDATTISPYVIVTLGEEGSMVYNNKQTLKVGIVRPKSVTDPTGAGDAYRAGFFTGHLRGYPIEICAKMGAMAGTYCVEEPGPQNAWYNYDQFQKRYQSAWKAELPPLP